MKISAFTILRNGIQFDFPFRESIKSVLPLCDEFIVNVGRSDDGTWQALEELKRALPPAEGAKITLFESVWPLDDPEKRKGGQILADQTNLAAARCTGDWCFYLQADEVLHEDDLPLIRKQLAVWASDPAVEAIVFNYVHFYAAYDVVQVSRSSYRREIRAIRNHLGIRSTGDAQSFRHADGSKLKAALSTARIFHYGWVRPQEVMRTKTGFMDTLYHSNAKADAPATGNNYQYKRFVGLRPFNGTHPSVMRDRVRQAQPFDLASAPWAFELKDCWKIVSGLIERVTGIRPFEYKNYKPVR